MPIQVISNVAIKGIIDAVRAEIGRTVTFYTQNLSPCPLCLTGNLYDSLGDISFNITCPTCAGTYWLNTATPTEVLARVHWVNDEAITATPGGKYYIGEATLTIDPTYLDLAEACQNERGRVVVDGHDMTITKIIPFGGPAINRYRVILKNMGDRPT